MKMELILGKTAIVTGGFQGIGKEIAQKLADNGASVLIVDINKQVKEIASEMNTNAVGEILSFHADLTCDNSIKELVSFAKSKFDQIDILINNAGIMQTKPFMEVTGDDWDNVLTINLKSMFLLSKQVVKEMIHNENGGSIINISSIAGRRGRPLAPHYAASKAGVISLTKSMAEAFGKQNIRTNSVCPGVIRTPMMEQIYKDRKDVGDSENIERTFLNQIKLNRLGVPEDIANTVLFLSSSLSDYINGQAINVCGGFEMD